MSDSGQLTIAISVEPPRLYYVNATVSNGLSDSGRGQSPRGARTADPLSVQTEEIPGESGAEPRRTALDMSGGGCDGTARVALRWTGGYDGALCSLKLKKSLFRNQE